ncbi:DUF6343 family protein [Streptomyces sp. TG1A-60]|uniref:DUF6343 family protein n=1 Tax=Streptomyces sp. TG1A-60 TaxID=3129111 RepID=UPI0030CB8237
MRTTRGTRRARRTRRTGSEPRTALSALRLRLILAGVFLPFFAAATVLFAVWAANSGSADTPGSGALTVLAVVCGALALTAVVDLVVVARRLRRE